jgi:exosortase
MKRRSVKNLLFFLLTIVAIWIAFSPLYDLLRNTKETEYYSHIPLIPVVSAYFFFIKRKDAFLGSNSLFFPGLFVMAAGLAILFVWRARHVNPNDYAAIATSAALVFWLGSVLFLYGKDALKKVFFPLGFLVFSIPLPSILMDRIISGLVLASTGVTQVLFRAMGVPFIQEGSVFHLPDFSLEIAKECSGIRSSLALLITSILAGHLFLRKFRNKAVLALAVFPIAVFKNGLRIVSLYLLSYYIDMRFIEGDFHHKFAGSVFFVLGLVFLGIVLWWLGKSEKA